MLGGTGFSGSASQEQLISVRTADVAAVHRFAETDEFVSAALGKIDSGVFQGGLSVNMYEFDKKVELSADHQSVIHQDWREAASQLNRALFIVGYAVVRPVPHPKYAGEFLPYVVPYNRYELQFVETSQMPRRYFVNFNDVAYPGATLAELADRPTSRTGESVGLDANGLLAPTPPPKQSRTLAKPTLAYDPSVIHIQANENNVGYPMIDGGRAHLIFVRCPPTVEGYLQSPVAILRASMTGWRQLLDSERYASYWAAHPLHVVGITKNFFNAGGGGTTGRETFGVGTFAEGDTRMEAEKFRYERNEAEYIDFRLAQDAAEKGRALTLEGRERAKRALYSLSSATHYDEAQNPNSAVAPSDFHNLVLGANQAMTTGPTPQTYANLERMRDIVLDTAFALLNIV